MHWLWALIVTFIVWVVGVLAAEWSRETGPQDTTNIYLLVIVFILLTQM